MIRGWAILVSVLAVSAARPSQNQTLVDGGAEAKAVSSRLCDRVGGPAKLELVPFPNHGDVCRFSDGSGDFGCSKYCRKMDKAPWCATAHQKEATPCRPLEADAKDRAAKGAPAARTAHGAAETRAKGAKEAPREGDAKAKGERKSR
jgi:hypothetical protein